MKLPGPDHPISITPNPRRVRVTFNGVVVADSTRALTLREATLPPVQYIAREDVRMDLLTPTAHGTHCPYKGDASYYTIRADGRVAENAVWVYETAFASVAEIEGRLAFYPDRVDTIED
ncbi:MAG TPA: DUF427 domain-containing protein, partial [Arenibaculum sp.]|nr:DUF427 domain-containing protein [Arenibaculum sp.]